MLVLEDYCVHYREILTPKNVRNQKECHIHSHSVLVSTYQESEPIVRIVFFQIYLLVMMVSSHRIPTNVPERVEVPIKNHSPESKKEGKEVWSQGI